MLGDLTDLLAFEAGALGFDEREEKVPEDTLHEHRCSTPDCGMYWTCRKTDCTNYDRCEECERQDWADAHDPQPELQLTGEDNF